MLGLAGAVKDLHSENCRHGDLKPENILQFNKADEELLVIADVSMSRIHKEATHLRTGGLTIRDTTSKYEAPEAYMYVKAPRSRKYDIWSLGCVFLEFVIWFLYDFEAIEIFSYDRAEVDNCMYFYTSTRKGIEIHPRVSEVIQVLRQDIRCQGGTGFEALLSLIEDSLLQVEVERRDTAIGVVTILEAILMEAEKSPSYMMNLSDALPTKPLVFQRQHRNPIACGFMDPLTTG
jgi:serine/threonine protein kinase